MIKTRIEITPYLAEYLTCKFYDPESDAVRIPDTKDLYHTIWDLMSKRPDNAVDTGNLTLVLPDRRTGKDPEYYNYLGERSARIIDKRVRVMFYAELHDRLDENKHRYNIEYIDTVHHFMCKYNITSISEDGLLKNYYCWRDNERKKKAKRDYKKRLNTP